MGFIKNEDKWVSKDEENYSIVGPSGTTTYEYGMHLIFYIPPEDHGEPLSPFEKIMLNQMDTMALVIRKITVNSMFHDFNT